MTSALSRRRALSGAATLGMTLPVLAACGDGSAGGDAEPASGPSSAGSATDAGRQPTTSSPSSSSSSSSSAPASEALTSTTDVPEGGGVVLADDKVVVTQPAAGEFKCFSAICTHLGCVVADVTSTINCTCHGSSFDISTGAVVGGPAPSPLSAVDITVDGDRIELA